MIIIALQVSSGPRCLLSGTSVDIQCVNFGFPRPEIIFFKGVEQVTPSQGSFERYMQLSFDTIRISGVRETDLGDFICEARMGINELRQSRPVRLVFCSKWCVTAFSPHQLLMQQPSVCLSLSYSYSSAHHREPTSTNDSH